MKKRSLLAKKMEQFYEEIETKRDSSEQMKIQTDLEFRQREIKKVNLTLLSKVNSTRQS